MGEYTHSLNSRFEIGRFRPFSLLIIAVTISAISAIFGNVALPFILPSIVTVFLWKYFGEDRKIRNIILIALWIKIIVSTIYYFYLSTKTFPYSQQVKAILFGGDGEMYSAHAWFVAILNTGKDMLKNNFVGTGGFYSDASIYQQLFLIDKFIPMDTYQVGFFTYLIAIIYSVFDYSPLLINFINCVLGVFSAVLIYKTTLLFFSKTAAKASLLLTLFFPTLFIWSSLTKLRDPLYAFMTILFLYLCVKIILQKKILKLL